MGTIDFLRQFRIGGFALFDFTVAFLGVYLLAPLLSKIFRKFGIEIPRRSWLLWTIPIGVAVHLLIGKITPLTREFIDPRGHYLVKIIVLGLVILGAWGIRRTKA
jgi:hypothetical protein